MLTLRLVGFAEWILIDLDQKVRLHIGCTMSARAERRFRRDLGEPRAISVGNPRWGQIN